MATTRKRAFRVAVSLLTFSFLGADWQSGRTVSSHDGDRRDRTAHSAVQRRSAPSEARVIYKMHYVAVTPPNPAKTPGLTTIEQPNFAYPNKDASGATISKPAAGLPPHHHASIVRNVSLVQSIKSRQAGEAVPQRYYWHEQNSVPYCHYLDKTGTHWYGFYHGPTFYWARLHGDRWWWFDSRHRRWAFWANGFWWSPGPRGEEYVYVDSAYYPYGPEGVVTVDNPEVQAPPADEPAPGEGQAFTSQDGMRMVQIFGDREDAFLYSTSGDAPVYLAHLGQGVAKVRFRGGTGGTPLKILVDFKDGNFAFFDADGGPLDSPAISADDMPGPPPSEIPPAPEDPPGQ
jgi:hypothetical protein